MTHHHAPEIPGRRTALGTSGWKSKALRRGAGTALLLNFCVAAALWPGPSAAQTPLPIIDINNNTRIWKQLGRAGEAQWVDNNRWGAAGLTEGPLSTQYEQYTGISPNVGPNGEIAFRAKWRWPKGTTEVKGFPSALVGRKPGYYNSIDTWVDGRPVQLPDGSHLTQSPTGHTPATFFPLALPVQSLKAKAQWGHVLPPTGQGQLTYDIWLQSGAKQDMGGLSRSSITHEIMIVLGNWGNYGAHNVNGGRWSFWYDHTATIGGRTFHVYATKTWDMRNGVAGPNHEALLYNFGWLDGSYGRSGWKMIAFVPETLPVSAGELDLAAIINHLPTRKDKYGNPWATGNEYVASIELGVEPVEGTGDIVVHDYKVSQSSMSTGGTGTTPTTTTPPPPTTTAPPPTTACATYATWSSKTMYQPGQIVTATDGNRYVATTRNKGLNPLGGKGWARYYC